MKELIKDENFYETQQFRQLWVWTIILLVMFALITPIFFGVIGIILSIVLVSFSFGLIFLFWKMKLITTIKEDGINIIFVPFTNFIIPFSKIKYYKIREYRPIIEYGGWGIRFNKSGKAYTVCGTTGLQISLLNGKEILIGTQRPDPILESLNKKMMLQ